MKGDEETRRAGMSVAKGMEAKLKRRSRGSDLERIFRQRELTIGRWPRFEN